MRKNKPQICVAPNGATKVYDDHTQIPLTNSEIAACAKECLDAGADMIHVHIRDFQLKHSLESQTYIEVIDSIKQATNGELKIQITTESAGIYKPHQQMRCIYEVKPDYFSVSIKEIFSDHELYIDAINFINWCDKSNIEAQFIIYDVNDLIHYQTLLDQRLFPNQKHTFLFVLGRYDKEKTGEPHQLIPLINQLNLKESTKHMNWSVCAFGKYEWECLVTAVLLGGSVRVGFENNILNKQGKIAANNAELVSQIHDFIQQSPLLNRH